eukprot:scaffold2391_cov113-Cylindrotheca_fusiformis.AAC.3
MESQNSEQFHKASHDPRSLKGHRSMEWCRVTAKKSKSPHHQEPRADSPCELPPSKPPNIGLGYWQVTFVDTNSYT